MQRFLVPCLLVCALAACDPLVPDTMPTYPQPKTLKVDHVRLEMKPVFAPNSSELAVSETARLETFLNQSGLRANERLFIASSNGDKLAAARVGRIVRILSEHGLGAETITVPAPGVEANHLLLLVDRYVATVPPCPDFSQPDPNDHLNMTPPNFGCATVTNLGMMIDDPRDIVMGRTMGPADAEPSTGAFDRYRTGAVKPFITSQGAGGGAGGSAGAAAGAAAGMGTGPAPGGQ
jgi:pilus assembly protein CpaD